MGDACEFINTKDPRFDASSLAEWVEIKYLSDLAKYQAERFIEFIEPIAHKCLVMISGNHEEVIKRYYERDIHLEIVSAIKELGGFPSDYALSFDMSGWLRLVFYRHKKKRSGATMFDVNLHHGFVGGKLAGAKALNMQRWLWSHEADLVIFGHSHNISSQVEAVQYVTKNNEVHTHRRVGVYAGSFMERPNYAVSKGYFPLPSGHIEIVLRPGTENEWDRIRVNAG